MIKLEDIVDQLERYGGEPDQRILDLLFLITDLNDDIKHDRLLGYNKDRIVKRLAEIVREEDCPGHVASAWNAKVCGRCGVHIDSLRPPEDGE